jgi:hypothetical protein
VPKHCFEAPTDGTLRTVGFNWPDLAIPSQADLMQNVSLVNVATGEIVSAP